MNVLFLTIAWPKNGRNLYVDLIQEFTNNGNNVTVVASDPSLSKDSELVEVQDSLKIIWVKTGRIEKTGRFEKAISLLLLNHQYRKAIDKYILKGKFDLILMSTPPINLLNTYLYCKKKYKATTYLLLKDIWPQGPADLGAMSKGGIIYRYFKYLEKKTYENSDYIGCMSYKNLQYVLKHNRYLQTSKLEINPNSMIPDKRVCINEIEKVKLLSKYGIPNNKTIFIFGGNLSKPQGIDFVIKAFEACQDIRNAFFLVIGAGTEAYKVKNYIESSGEKCNALFINYLPRNEYDMILACADVGLIFLSDMCTIPHVPSRLLSYLNYSKPILAATNEFTDLKEIILNNGIGFWIRSNSTTDFHEAIVELMNENKRKVMGENARRLLIKDYTAEKSYQIINSHMSIK